MAPPAASTAVAGVAAVRHGEQCAARKGAGQPKPPHAPAAALAPTLPCGGCTRLPVLQPRQALRRLWRTIRLLMVGLGVLSIGTVFALIATERFAAYYPTAPGAIAVSGR